MPFLPFDIQEKIVTKIELKKDKIPFWQGGSGNLTLDVGAVPLNQPLAPSNNDLANFKFGVKTDSPFTFGAPNNFKLNVAGGTSAALSPIWASSSEERRAVLAKFGLENYFETHPDALILALLLNANADLSATGTFKYSVLDAKATLEAGGQAGYAYLQPFAANEKVEDIIGKFFSDIKLPYNITSPPQQGEVIAFEYGGYLKVGAKLSMGYQLTGSSSFDIGQLQLSEKYSLSVIGSLGMKAGIAGYFQVVARAAEDENGNLIPGWVRVKVHKKRQSEFGISADLEIDANLAPEKLPGTGREFISAALGINAKNWLNQIERIGQLADFEKLKTELDGLAKRFLAEWIDKAFDQLSQTDFPVILQKINKVVESYRNVEETAITLFDRYFNKLDFLTAKLEELINLTSWEKLKGEIDGELWQILRQLTNGDPLGWILGQVNPKDSNGNPINIPNLEELKNRVRKVLDLIKSDAHEEIRKFIKLAKEKFPLDNFITQLSAVDSIPELKALANTKLGDFIERLVGRAIEQMSSNSDLNEVVGRIQKSIAAIGEFENKIYKKFQEALTQNFKATLNANYTRTSERDALIDVMIRIQDNVGNPISQGQALMHAAGSGDFQAVLAAYQPELVKIKGGTLTHQVRKESSFNITIAGWHSRWHYQGFDRVITNAEQQIVAGANGGLTIYTTIDLTKEKERKRINERMYTNFLLRFIGESSGVLKFDRKNQQYLIDSITGMGAKYRLVFEDEKTTEKELKSYLSYAQELGLDNQATFDNLKHFLPKRSGSADNYGRVSVDYEVRYAENGLKRLFTAQFNESQVREIMRKLVLAYYLHNSDFTEIAWGYWSDSVYQIWKEEGPSFSNIMGNKIFPSSQIKKSPFASVDKPSQINLKSSTKLELLSVFYRIENDMVAGLKKLFSLVTQGGQLEPSKFESALSKFGSALKQLDGRDEGVNTVFGVFDQLIQLQMPAAGARASTLTLVSEAEINGEKKSVTKQFISNLPGQG